MLAEVSHIPVNCVCTLSQDRTPADLLSLGQVFHQAELLGYCHPFAPHAESGAPENGLFSFVLC